MEEKTYLYISSITEQLGILHTTSLGIFQWFFNNPDTKPYLIANHKTVESLEKAGWFDYDESYQEWTDLHSSLYGIDSDVLLNMYYLEEYSTLMIAFSRDYIEGLGAALTAHYNNAIQKNTVKNKKKRSP